MSVQAPPESNKLRWIFSAILCLCTLVALWATAARVKALKMAARYGERIATAPIDAGATSTVTLHRGQRMHVGHFGLEFSKGEAVLVLDGSGALLAEFPALQKGEMRRWQELQLTFADVGPESAKVEVEFKPGSPCFGSGRYHGLREGLQILFPGERSITIAKWDGVKPEARLHLEGPAGTVDFVINPGSSTGEGFRLRFQLERDGSLDLRDLK